jgi:hypothetical protein
MPLHRKLIDLKQFIKNKRYTTSIYHKTNDDKNIGSEIFNEEMFIGSAFGSDLRNAKKQKKGIKLHSIKELESLHSMRLIIVKNLCK